MPIEAVNPRCISPPLKSLITLMGIKSSLVQLLPKLPILRQDCEDTPPFGIIKLMHPPKPKGTVFRVPLAWVFSTIWATCRNLHAPQHPVRVTLILCFSPIQPHYFEKLPQVFALSTFPPLAHLSPSHMSSRDLQCIMGLFGSKFFGFAGVPIFHLPDPCSFILILKPFQLFGSFNIVWH